MGERNSPLTAQLVRDGLKPPVGPVRTMRELLAEHRAMKALLGRIVKLADSGHFRDHARLSIGATPIMDEVRGLIERCEAPTGELS